MFYLSVNAFLIHCTFINQNNLFCIAFTIHMYAPVYHSCRIPRYQVLSNTRWSFLKSLPLTTKGIYYLLIDYFTQLLLLMLSSPLFLQTSIWYWWLASQSQPHGDHKFSPALKKYAWLLSNLQRQCIKGFAYIQSVIVN